MRSYLHFKQAKNHGALIAKHEATIIEGKEIYADYRKN